MFDLVAQAMIAWNQVGLLVGAGLLGGFGGLMLGSRVYSRWTGAPVLGTIIGVRRTARGLYYPVYRYTLPTGEVFEATSDTASNATSRMNTGRTVGLLVPETNPSRVAEADSYVAEIAAAIMIAAGGGLGYFVLTAWPVTKVTWVVLAAMVIYGAVRLTKSLRPQDGPRSASAWRQQRQQQLEASPVRPVEDFLSDSGDVDQQRKLSPVVPPVLVILAIGMLAASLHVGRAAMQLGSNGHRAPGTVVQLQADSDSDHRTAYHAVVRFSPEDGSPVEFKDHFGSNPPAYHTHDAVTVLYAPNSPQRTAIVDRGLWNWIPTVALCLFGVILAVAGMQLRRNSTPTTRPGLK
jgi:hypothetical protein